jgi:hypothetical protein
MNFYTLDLNEGEELLAVMKRHVTSFFKNFFEFLVICAVAFSVNKFLPASTLSLIITILLGLTAFGYLVYKFTVWYSVCLIITTQRIIDVNQKTLTKRIVTEVQLADIEKVLTYESNFFLNFLNVGNLVIQVKNGGKIVFANVHDPQGLMININRLKKDSVNHLTHEDYEEE